MNTWAWMPLLYVAAVIVSAARLCTIRPVVRSAFPLLASTSSALLACLHVNFLWIQVKLLESQARTNRHQDQFAWVVVVLPLTITLSLFNGLGFVIGFVH